jgi:hypothetical protein
MERNRYCIVYEGQYGDWYSYITKDNICELAKYLNEKVLRHRADLIKAVYLTDDYLDAKIDNLPKVFFQTEYNEQYFLETYEDRLLEKYRQEKLAI